MGPLDLENRRTIFDHIAKRPGTYVREMERELGLAMGVLSYHLDQLERKGLIRSEDDGYRRRYFPVEGFRLRDRRLASVIRQKGARTILLLLLEEGEASFNSILREMGVAKSTLSYHLKRLVEKGIVEEERIEREKHYRLAEPEDVIDAFLLLKGSMEADAADRFAEIWERLSG
jgi:predicted transcriptional regulator